MKKVTMMILGVALLALAGGAEAVGTGSVDMITGWYPAGTVITNTATPDANNQFDYWTGDVTGADTSVNARIVFTANSAKTITAWFSHIMWDVVASAGANGTITPLGTTSVAQSSNITYTITPDATFDISDVLVDSVSVGATNSYTFSNVSTSHTIAASFVIKNYQVVFDLDGKGTHSGGGALTQYVDHGSAAIAPTVTANTGWVTNGWNKSFASITNATTVTALYTPEQITLTIVSPRGAGTPAVNTTVTNDYGTAWVASISDSPIIIVEDTKYDCTGWVGAGSIGNGSGTNTPSFSLTNNTTITWQWSTNYYINFDVQGN